jgi:hypothetical protein
MICRGSPAARGYFASLAIWCVSRDTLRLAVFLCTWPWRAARISAGSACFIASSALLRSPEAMASSTLRSELRIRDRRALLISVRRVILRSALRAEEVLAMNADRNLSVEAGWITKSNGGEDSRRQRAAYSQQVFCRQ